MSRPAGLELRLGLALALGLAGAGMLAVTGCGGGDGQRAAAPAGEEAAEPAAEPAAKGRRGSERRAAAAEPTELPPHFQGLMRSEMASLEPAMQRLLAFIAQGNARAGATVARQIEQTFVLDRALSQQERRRLHNELPADFLDRDRAFHRRAGALAQALEQGDFATASKSYAAMTRMCVSCHALYATHRFPTLAGAAAADDDDDDAP